MTQSELVNAIASKHHEFSEADVKTCVGEILSSIADALVNGRRVEIRGFGAFFVKDQNARIRRNPNTGETFLMGVKRTPRFRAGMELKRRVF